MEGMLAYVIVSPGSRFLSCVPVLASSVSCGCIWRSGGSCLMLKNENEALSIP